MFGSLSELSNTTATPSLNEPLLNEPRLIATIDTKYETLRSVKCVSENQVWTRGDGKTMKLFNLRGKLLASLQSKSGDTPWDIAVTLDGDVVYTDYHNNTINLVKNKKNKKIRTMITLHDWKPLYACCTVRDDLLVTMGSGDKTQTKVVRYSGSVEKQSIQFDDQGRPLYSSDHNHKFIIENRNRDICVTDYMGSAVVVVNELGKLRFRYTGHPSTKQSFDPLGLATDSHSHILVAEVKCDRIHIIDKDGEFLGYIQCDLHRPHGLSVDIKDNLFVAELHTAKVKKIQYL
jgi:hypothetical protein